MIALIIALGMIVLVGLCVAAYYCVGGLTLNLEIKPIELANFLVGAFIAFFLQYYLASRATDKRVEKDMLIDGFRDALSILRTCRTEFFARYESRKAPASSTRTILTLVRNLANALESSENTLVMSHCSKLQGECRSIMQDYLAYKAAITGGQFPSKAYDASSASEHERTYRKLHNSIQSTVLKINNHRS